MVAQLKMEYGHIIPSNLYNWLQLIVNLIIYLFSIKGN